jgi:hypothetical protein
VTTQNEFETTFTNRKRDEDAHLEATEALQRAHLKHSTALGRAEAESDAATAYAAHLEVKRLADRVRELRAAERAASKKALDSRCSHAEVCKQIHGDPAALEQLQLERIARALRGGQ